MIVEFFLGIAQWFVEWIASLFGEWTPPAELLDATSGVSAVLGGIAGMGVWIEWTVLGACVAVQVGVWAVVLGIKLVRALLAHVPLFGGAGD